MSNSAKNALQKIIEAFGTTPKTLTRIQIFAKIAKITSDIEAKRLYPDIPDIHRTQVLEALKQYFLHYRAEEYLIHQKLFYPRALVYWALRKVAPDEQTAKATARNAHSFIHEASKVAGYTDVFREALNELQKNPDAYPTITMHDLMDDLSEASTINVPLLRAHFRVATGYTRNETMQLLDSLSRFAHIYDAEEVTAAIQQRYSPAIGPDTPEEFYFTMLMLYHYAAHPMIPKTPEFKEMMGSFGNLMDLSRFLCRDIPTKNLEDQLRVFPISPGYFLAKSKMDYTHAVPNALAMGRYFIERHRDKLQPQGMLALSEALADLYIKSFFHDQNAKSRFGAHVFNDEDTENLIQRMLHESWAEWEKPSVDEMVLSIDSRLKGKNKLKFHALLDQADVHFDLQVSYYIEQNEAVRKLRRNLFKNGSIGEDTEGHRATFLKGLVDTQRHTLVMAGFSDDDIGMIATTGKLPPSGTAQPKWNVDHVVDIHAGGTNNPENLCLMPTSLNEMKNSFLLFQTGLNSDVKQGFWVLTLRPKLGADGKPTSILMDNKRTVTTLPLRGNDGPV